MRRFAPLARASGRGAGGEGRRSKTRTDSLKHALRIGQYVVIPEPQHAESLCAEQRIPRTISSGLVLVLTTVDLNNEPLRDADKVDYEWADRSLTAEFVRTESA